MKYLNRVLFWIKKNACLFLSVLLLTMTVAIFGPLELYFTNYEEFWFACSDMGIIVVFFAGSCFVILMIIGALLRGRGREAYSSILFALGLALYIQGNYANINYGILDGKAIEWSAYPVYAILDTAGWILLVAIIMLLWFCKQNLFYKVQCIGALWIIAIQIVTLGTLVITTDVSKMEKSNYYLSSEGLYEVSAQENIIVFVLDTFDDMYFQEIIKTEPKRYETIFKDFTHFNNAAVGGWMTKMGMPAIITGEHYPGKITYSEYIKQAFNKDRLYSTLQEKNYDVRIYSNSLFVPDDSCEVVNNQVSTGYAVSSYSKLAQKYLSLTLYKYMPHMLKNIFWIYTGEFEQYKIGNSAEGYTINDTAFFNELKEKGLSVNQDKNIFKLIHLNGVHPPYTRDEYAQPANPKDTSAILQAKGVLYIVENYIDQLKKLGLYDKATIVIMADHGAETASTLGAHGVLLVKEQGSKGAYLESPAPVSYYDLHATLFQTVGVITEEPTFFEVPEGTRERYVYGFEAADDGRTTAVEYSIEGNLNKDGVLKKTGIILRPSDTKEQYEYGENLTFGGNNTVQPYVRKGISFIDTLEYLWTDGKQCEFEFELKKKPKNNLLVTLDIMTVYKDNGSQKIIIFANDVECARRILSNGEKLQFHIPGTVIEDDKSLVLRIELPNAASPAEHTVGNSDSRLLALALRGLQIDETDEDSEDTMVEQIEHLEFGQEGNVEEHLLDGWYTAEKDYRWTSAQAELRCKTETGCDYYLELHYVNYAASGNTNIYVNDTLLTTLDGSESIARIEIPSEVLHKDGNQVISFETPEAISPKVVEENGDDRV